MTLTTPTPLVAHTEGLTEMEGTTFYVIPDVASLPPFLMSLVSDSDHWCFLSSTGALTAGRREAATALFPYETDDRLHLAAGISGPATVVRVTGDEGSRHWEPFGRCATVGSRRAIAKSILGDVVIFEEVDEALGLAVRFRWGTSDRFGLVRKVELTNIGDTARRLSVTDGLVNLMPQGLDPAMYRASSNLTNAYRRSQLVGGPANLALHTLESLIVDQAIPAEALRATTSWSIAPGSVTVDRGAIAAARAGDDVPLVELMTGRPGAHLVAFDARLAPGEGRTWFVVADVAQDHSAVTGLRRYLAAAHDIENDVEVSLRQDSECLAARLATADGMQQTGDDRASAHHLANVLFNAMRGGVFEDGYRCSAADFAGFVAQRNRSVAQRCAPILASLPAALGHADLVAKAAESGDPDLERLAFEYLPLTFSRRHGDPSRPWNRFSIRIREPDGTPVLRYEGNWRDIFQNWEALSLSFPDYLPSMISVFVNASTPDGFNPYRLSREGIEWEAPDRDDPWSNIGYWGDHQIVYLLRLLEAADRLLPGAIGALLERRIFTYADVPYRLKPYDDLVADPRSSIEYDEDAADAAFARVERIGGDGKLIIRPDGTIYRTSLLEKLLVPALSKLSCFVPGGGIWMNTQRPEWNDANNALAGYGLSMVTLCYLRRYLVWLSSLTTRVGQESFEVSAEVAGWLVDVHTILESHRESAWSSPDDRRRATIMRKLGLAFSAYRSKIYAGGFSNSMQVATAGIRDLCEVALAHLDASIRESRRPDGLYHSYNLIHFGADGEIASIDRLPEMLEGQVAALSCGILDPAESAGVIDALYAGALYRPDQDSFILYPDRHLPDFLDKNVVSDRLISSNPLFVALLAVGDESVVIRDVDGVHHFNAELRHAADLERALDRLTSRPEFRPLVEAHRQAALEAYEEVFHHHAFTGRSGSMYAYEGLGSIYWHMVGKLMVATQECVVSAHRSGARLDVVDRLRRGYFRIRDGLGFNKTAADYGAFPTDPYSHTPAHAGAQQPGMTGQVKEEILTRTGELGVWFQDGELSFDPLLLRPREFTTGESRWRFYDIDGRPQTMELAAGSFALTLCQVPVVVTAAEGVARIDVVRSDGSVTHVEGTRLDRTVSRELFERSGSVAELRVHMPGALDPR